jgi:hypothetical protein
MQKCGLPVRSPGSPLLCGPAVSRRRRVATVEAWIASCCYRDPVRSKRLVKSGG